MIELRIDEATPSLNTMLRRHWSVDKKLKNKWRLLIMAATCNQAPGFRIPLQQARITITRISPRLLDSDNATGGTKHLVDALRQAKLIVDDTPQHIELIVRQQKGKAATLIQIEPMGATT